MSSIPTAARHFTRPVLSARHHIHHQNIPCSTPTPAATAFIRLWPDSQHHGEQSCNPYVRVVTFPSKLCLQTYHPTIVLRDFRVRRVVMSVFALLVEGVNNVQFTCRACRWIASCMSYMIIPISSQVQCVAGLHRSPARNMCQKSPFSPSCPHIRHKKHEFSNVDLINYVRNKILHSIKFK